MALDAEIQLFAWSLKCYANLVDQRSKERFLYGEINHRFPKRGVFLERFLRHFADFYPLRNVMVYPMRLKNGDKFVLTFGVYATRADAEVFLANVPSYFVGGRPFAQPITASIAEAAIW